MIIRVLDTARAMHDQLVDLSYMSVKGSRIGLLPKNAASLLKILYKPEVYSTFYFICLGYFYLSGNVTYRGFGSVWKWFLLIIIVIWFIKKNIT